MDEPRSEEERAIVAEGEACGWRFRRATIPSQRAECCSVYVASLGALPDTALLELLKPYGRVLRLTREDASKAAFATFTDAHAAAAAVAGLNGQPCEISGSRKIAASLSVMVKPPPQAREEP